MDSNKKIAVNSVIIFLRLCIVTVISILVSRYVLQALGASDYGLYNVVGGLVGLLNVVNTAMITTTYRYIAFELGKGAEGNQNKVFNTSLTIHFFIGLGILILGFTVGEWYVLNYLNVAEGKMADAQFVFVITIITTFFSTLLVPFKGLLIAYENFKVSALLEIASHVFKLCGVLFLLNYDGSRIRLYSLVMLGFCMVEGVGNYLYSHRHYLDTIKFRRYNDNKLYKEMMSFTGWILFGAVSGISKTQGTAVIINYFFGTIVNAAFAVATQVENCISMFARSLNNAAVPQITKSFSSGDSDRSVKLASYISKYTFALMIIISFPVLMEMEYLLRLWLKDVPEGAVAFCKIMILQGLIGCLGEGIPALVQASGKIKLFQIILSTISILGLPIAVVFFMLGYPPQTINVVFCGCYIVAALVRLVLLKVVLKMDIGYFIKTSYFRIALMSIPLLLVYLFVHTTDDMNHAAHILNMVLFEVITIITIILLGIDRNERTLVSNYVRDWKQKKRNMSSH